MSRCGSIHGSSVYDIDWVPNLFSFDSCSAVRMKDATKFNVSRGSLIPISGAGAKAHALNLGGFSGLEYNFIASKIELLKSQISRGKLRWLPKLIRPELLEDDGWISRGRYGAGMTNSSGG